MFKRTFFRGLAALAPVALTVALIIWLYDILERYAMIPVMKIVGPEYYFPGLGILCVLVVVFFAGIILNNWLMQWLYDRGEKIVKRIPLIKTLYVSITDLMSFFRAGEESKGDRVVTIDFNGMRLIGFVTRDSFDDLPEGIGKQDDVAVFLPFSYQIGGYTVMMPRKEIKSIDMKVEDALRFAMTAGAQGKQESIKKAAKKKS